MARLFNRVASLTLARPRPKEFFRTDETNAVIITDLRFSFSISKDRNSEPNSCELLIYNLSPNSRALLQERPLIARLQAGYDGGLRTLFVGDVRHAQSTRTDTGWESLLQLGDGDRAFKHARVKRSFRGGVKLSEALREVIRSMGLDISPETRNRRELRRQLVAGVAMFGASRDEMSRLLAPAGLGWTVQNGQLEVFKLDEPKENRALEISIEKGMVGVPEFGDPPKKGKPPVLTARTLLYPGLVPGGKVSVTSRTVTGVFRIDKVTHEGDTHGDDWITEIEALSV